MKFEERKEQLRALARQTVAYTLSVPERTLRSVAALAGGTTTLLTENLLPESLRKTTTYTVTVGMVQQFVIERVAGMETELAKTGAPLSEDYVQRKLAGNALEAAGLLTVGFSPLWIFAIAGDVAGGSKLFLNRLVGQLKENGVIDEAIEPKTLVDVLEAAQASSSKSATALDQPPLSREELTGVVDSLRESYGEAFKRTNNLMPTVDSLWQRMEHLANRDNISIERLSGMMTIDAASWSKTGTDTASAVGQVSADLFDEKILDSYRKTLEAASEEGVQSYIGKHYRPFLNAALSHFKPSQKTWTEQKLEERSQQ